MLRPQLRNALNLIGGEAATRLLNFFATVLLARRLGIDTFGQLGFATAVMAYGVALSDFGLVTTGTRLTAQHRSDPVVPAGSVFGTRLAAGAVAALLTLVAALLLPKTPTARLLVAVYALAVVVQTLSLEWFFLGLEQTLIVALARTVTAVGYLAGCWLFVRGPADVLVVPVALVLAMLAGSLILWLSATFRQAKPLHPTLRGWRPILTASWPIGLAGFAAQLHMNCGPVALGLLRGDYETGVYSGAARIALVLLAIDRVFYSVYFPVIARAVSASRERVVSIISLATRLALAVTLPFSVLLTALAPWVVTQILGARYLASAQSLALLSAFLPLTVVNSVYGYALMADGRERVFLQNVVIGAAASVTAAVVLAAVFGVVGAALALLAGEALMVALMIRSCWRAFAVRFERRLAAPFVAALLMVAVVLLFRHQRFLQVSVGLLVYVTVLVLTGGVRRQDLLVRNMGDCR